MIKLTPEQISDFEDAHHEGLHDDVPREGCPLCVQQGRAAPAAIERKD